MAALIILIALLAGAAVALALVAVEQWDRLRLLVIMLRDHREATLKRLDALESAATLADRICRRLDAAEEARFRALAKWMCDQGPARDSGVYAGTSAAPSSYLGKVMSDLTGGAPE